jgi:hypothetical protein
MKNFPINWPCIATEGASGKTLDTFFHALVLEGIVKDEFSLPL